MKRIALAIILVLSLGLNNAIWAENNSANNHQVRTINVPHFARPLVEKWIEEYAQAEPNVEFKIVKGQDNIDLSIVLEARNADNKDFNQIVYFAETAVLPITARSSKAAHLLKGKHLNSKKLKQLFFLNDELEEDGKKNETLENIIIYSGSNASSVTAAFAHNFGEESGNIRGKRIAGDDLFLNTALQKDSHGVSFNALSNIFDLESRHLKSNLSLVGINVKRNLEECFCDNTTLDDILEALENEKISEVAIDRIGVSYHVEDEIVSRFIEWVINQGTKYNHEYGMLNLDSKTAHEEVNKIKNTLTAKK